MRVVNVCVGNLNDRNKSKDRTRVPTPNSWEKGKREEVEECTRLKL